MCGNSSENNGFIRLPLAFFFSLLTLSCYDSVLISSRYTRKITPVKFHEGISMTSYPQHHGHGYATDNNDWLQ